MDDDIETSKDFKKKIKSAYEKLGEINNNDITAIYDQLVDLKKIVDKELAKNKLP